MVQKNLHIVFPKDYLPTLLEGLATYPNINVTGTDYDLDGFYHYALKEGEIPCDTAVLIVDMRGDIPIEHKAEEIVNRMTEIRINRPHIRLIVSMSKSFEHLVSLKQSLVSLSIYDIHFQDSFVIDDMIDWIEQPRSLADMKEYIVNRPSNAEKATKKLVVEEKKIETKLDANEGLQKKQPPRSRRALRNERSLKPVRDKTAKPIIEKQIIRETIEVTQKNIAFVSLSKGSGSTFHSINFSAYLSGLGLSIGFYEDPEHYRGKTYVADHFNIFEGEERYISIPHMLKNGNVAMFEKMFVKGNITFYPTNYAMGRIESFSEELHLRYINTGRHTFKIMDFGYRELDESTKRLLGLYDHIVVMMDMSPEQYLPNADRYEQLLDWAEEPYFPDIDFWLNPYSESVPKVELKMLELNKTRRIPLFERDIIIASMFDMKTVMEYDEEIASVLVSTYRDYCEEKNIKIPYKKDKKSGFLKKIMSR